MRIVHTVTVASFLAISFLAACGPTTPEPVTPASADTAPPAATAAPSTAPTATPSASPSAQAQTPPDGAVCTGKVDAPPAGLVPADKPAPGFAIGAADKGALCEGKVFTAKTAVTVYRVFSASYETTKRAGPLGAYWTFQKPSGTSVAYRASNAICTEWNDLDMLNECQLEVGAEVVMGPGQSAACNDGQKYAQSAVNQVLVVKKADGKVPVDGCKQSKVTWAQQ